MSPRTALYPGSFDVATLGHLDLIRRSAAKFDKLVVAVANNQEKSPLFTVNERVEMLREMTADLPNVEITSFRGLTVHYATEINAEFIIRGLRAVTDFEYELQLATMNRQLNGNIETIFMVPTAQYSFVSSSLVKIVASLGGDISEFVPPIVQRNIRKKFTRKKLT